MYNQDYFQAQAMEWGPRILGAIAILVVAWLVARAVRWAIARVVDRVPALRRHYQAEPGKTLGEVLGDIAYWLVLLIGIMLALQPLELGDVLSPVQRLTTNTFAFIPNVIGAGLIFMVGLLIARIARRLVEAALSAAHVDRWIDRAADAMGTGTEAETGTPNFSAPASVSPPAPTPAVRKASVSRSIGMLVFLLIMIPVTISALDALHIQAISAPATQMLQTILDAIPNVLGAAILLGIGYLVGRLVKTAVEQILPSLGFDRAIGAMGLSGKSAAASATVGTIAMLGVMIFFAIKAAELLQSALIATMLAAILELGSKVIVGAAIIVTGVAIARLVTDLAGAGSAWLKAILRWSIIALAVAMGLRFMGLANEIVIIAFTAVLGSAAVAAALAFGLGGRATAGRLLEDWYGRRGSIVGSDGRPLGATQQERSPTQGPVTPTPGAVPPPAG